MAFEADGTRFQFQSEHHLWDAEEQRSITSILHLSLSWTNVSSSFQLLFIIFMSASYSRRSVYFSLTLIRFLSGFHINACLMMQLNDLRNCKHSMVSETRTLLKDFIEFVESNRFKTMVNWCQSTLETPQHGNSSFLCSTCEMAVSYLKTFSKSEEAKSFVHQALDKICSLTGSFEVQCSFLGGMFIDKYIDTISSMDPDSACMTMHMCL
ncbi:unnamed protein product [Schistosoma haematobium]|nr:unnamed protein product [Schistosoma haematobium]